MSSEYDGGAAVALDVEGFLSGETIKICKHFLPPAEELKNRLTKARKKKKQEANNHRFDKLREDFIAFSAGNGSRDSVSGVFSAAERWHGDIFCQTKQPNPVSGVRATRTDAPAFIFQKDTGFVSLCVRHPSPAGLVWPWELA